MTKRGQEQHTRVLVIVGNKKGAAGFGIGKHESVRSCAARLLVAPQCAHSRMCILRHNPHSPAWPRGMRCGEHSVT